MSSLDSLSPRELKALKLSILSEHFGFSPESFATEGQDVVNSGIYSAAEKLETTLMERVEATEGIILDGEVVEAGIYKLETLLEAAVDKCFDLFEIYIFRNAFALKSEIIPYLILPHQTGLSEAMLDTDQAAMDEYEQEKTLYQAELQKEQALNSVAEFLERKLEGLREKAEEVGWLGSSSSLSKRVLSLTTSIPSLNSRLTTLLDTPITQPPPSTLNPDEVTPWGDSRAAYLNWTSGNKVAALPIKQEKSEGVVGSNVLAAMGQKEVAEALANAL